MYHLRLRRCCRVFRQARRMFARTPRECYELSGGSSAIYDCASRSRMQPCIAEEHLSDSRQLREWATGANFPLVGQSQACAGGLAEYSSPPPSLIIWTGRPFPFSLPISNSSITGPTQTTRTL